MIEAIANSKVRRMERELELHGIRLDSSNNDRAGPNSGRPSLGDNKAGHPGRPRGLSSV
jgi:hypothetical protein